jgi:hypothetical protein
MIIRTAETLRRGDLVAIGNGVYQIGDTACLHEASVRLTFQTWGSITVRRGTRLRVVGNEPLQPRKRRPGRPPTQTPPPDRFSAAPPWPRPTRPIRSAHGGGDSDDNDCQPDTVPSPKACEPDNYCGPGPLSGCDPRR